MRGPPAWSPRLRETVSDLVWIPFSHDCSNSRALLTKLMAFGRLAHSRLVQANNLDIGVLDNSLVLATVESCCLAVEGCGQVSFILVPLIQVTD